MRFIRPGSQVNVETGNDGVLVEARVIKVVLGEDGVEEYLCVWWMEGLRNCEWLEPSEVNDAGEKEYEP